MVIATRILSPMAKVFYDGTPAENEVTRFEGFQNERVSFQLALRPHDRAMFGAAELKLEIESPARAYLRARLVKCVPVRFGAYGEPDDDYLRAAKPGLYPDLLCDMPERGLRCVVGQWQSMWIDFEPNGALPAGEYPVTMRLCDPASGEIFAERTATVELLPAMLPPQTLIHTKWFHSDCLASYYHVDIFSEDYWRIVENFVRCAARHGINMLLTPIHTPPLDTRIGFERPTVQLVDVTIENGQYRFGFEKLDRWVNMALRCGTEYFEIAHLFTQWGAKCAPKIVATVDGEQKRIFGWDTSATGEAYKDFLAAYLPAVIGEMKKLGVDKKCFFHISDEPGEEVLDYYLAAKAVAAPYLTGYPIMDALSNVAFYKSGAVKKPVPAVNHIEPFLAEKVPGLWAYYCCGQHEGVSNLFISMPGARTRVLAEQLYKFDIEGFLQWGYNFYYSQGSDFPINPFVDTDCAGFAPAGDAYQVYPGPDGSPIESQRLMLVEEAMQDLRALQLLGSLAGRDTVLALIEEGLSTPLRFGAYPRGEGYILTLRAKVNAEIAKRL